MALYRSLKGGTKKKGTFIYHGQRLRFGEVVSSADEPVDGKGNSLCECPTPTNRACLSAKSKSMPCRHIGFELVQDTQAPVTSLVERTSQDFIKLAEEDSRTKPQIAKDIKEKYGVEVDHRPIRKADLLAMEYECGLLKGKDAAERLQQA